MTPDVPDVPLNCYEIDKEMAAPRKAKKIYFIDPLLYVVAGGYLRGFRNSFKWWSEYLDKSENRGNVFESIVVNHLARTHDPIYYWYSSNLKREVDVLLKQGKEIELYDVKLQQQSVKPAMGKAIKVITPENFI